MDGVERMQEKPPATPKQIPPAPVRMPGVPLTGIIPKGMVRLLKSQLCLMPWQLPLCCLVGRSLDRCSLSPGQVHVRPTSARPAARIAPGRY